MTDHPTPDRRPGRAAALGISRATARRLLTLSREHRVDLLNELGRVDSHAALAWVRLQPTAERSTH